MEQSQEQKPEPNVINFLLGVAPLDHLWFGDYERLETDRFWWRKELERVKTELTALREDNQRLRAQSLAIGHESIEMRTENNALRNENQRLRDEQTAEHFPQLEHRMLAAIAAYREELRMGQC